MNICVVITYKIIWSDLFILHFTCQDEIIFHWEVFTKLQCIDAFHLHASTDITEHFVNDKLIVSRDSLLNEWLSLMIK